MNRRSRCQELAKLDEIQISASLAMTKSGNTCLLKKIEALIVHPIDPYARICEAQMEGRANLRN